MQAIVRASAVMVALTFSLATTPVGAQSYDGGAIVKFGAFWQGTSMDISQTRAGVPAGSGSQDGWAHGGLSVGLDFHMPYNWMLGVEMDGSLGDARGFVGGVNYGFDYLFNLRGRVGYYTRPDLLVYATTGLSYLGFEAQDHVAGRLKVAETLGGWNVGVGVEYAWHHVILFGEYSHSFFGSRSFTLADVRHEADADVDVFRLGIKFKVGHDHHHGIGRHYDPPPPLK